MRQYKTKVAVCVLLALSMTSIAGAEIGSDHCRVVLDRAARNIAYSDISLDRAAYFYHKACKDRYERASSSERLMIQALIEEVPIGVDGSGERSKKEIKKWCDENSNFSSQADRFKSIDAQIFEPSIRAWSECIRTSQSNIAIVPIVSGDGRVVDIAVTNHTTDSGVMMRSVQVHTELEGDQGASCKVLSEHAAAPDPASDDALNGALRATDDSGTPLPVNHTVQINCTRQNRTESATATDHRFLPAMTISLSARALQEPFQLHLPRVDFPPQSILSQEAARLEKKISDLESTEIVAVPGDPVSVKLERDGKDRDSKSSPPIKGKDFCVITGYETYGSATGSCKVKWDEKSEGWVVTVMARNKNVECTATCFDLRKVKEEG